MSLSCVTKKNLDHRGSKSEHRIPNLLSYFKRLPYPVDLYEKISCYKKVFTFLFYFGFGLCGFSRVKKPHGTFCNYFNGRHFYKLKFSNSPDSSQSTNSLLVVRLFHVCNICFVIVILIICVHVVEERRRRNLYISNGPLILTVLPFFYLLYIPLLKYLSVLCRSKRSFTVFIYV